jgi:hypothetical protein
MWRGIREEDYGTKTNRRRESATTRKRRNNRNQEMPTKNIENSRGSIFTDSKQTSIGIGTLGARQRRKEKRVRMKARRP